LAAHTNNVFILSAPSCPQLTFFSKELLVTEKPKLYTDLAYLLAHATLHLPAGYVAEVSAAVQWAAAELQHESAATPRHTWLRCFSKTLIALCGICLHSEQLRSQPGYSQMLLPAGQLAYMLLEAEQQAAAVAAGSSSSSKGSTSTRHGGDVSSASQQQQPHMQPIDGVPGMVLEFLNTFGIAIYAGIPHRPLAVNMQLFCSEEVLQLLLAFTAVSVGAAHKMAAADTSRAARRRSSSSSSSKRGGQHSSATTAAAAAAADIPASHLDLLAAVSSALHKQLSRQYAFHPAAEDYGSFKLASTELREDHAGLVMKGLYCVLGTRGKMQEDDYAAKLAALMEQQDSSSSSSSSSSGGSSAALLGSLIAGFPSTVLPREQELLLPLLLTLVEHTTLFPAPNQGVLPVALSLVAEIMSQSSLDSLQVVPSDASMGSLDANEVAAALPDGLTAAVLLQLGPVVLQYLRDAAAATTGVPAVMEALLGSKAAGDAEDASIAAGLFATITNEDLGDRCILLSTHDGSACSEPTNFVQQSMPVAACVECEHCTSYSSSNGQ
jgi:hypothetical protein